MVEALTPVIFEGGTELLVVWEYFFYLGPEKCGVVHLLSVTQLVDYHVVYDFGVVFISAQLKFRLPEELQLPQRVF